MTYHPQTDRKGSGLQNTTAMDGMIVGTILVLIVVRSMKEPMLFFIKRIFVQTVERICGKEQTMSEEEALKAFEQMLSEIDRDNWLFVGTINPQMVEWAIKALKGAE